MNGLVTMLVVVLGLGLVWCEGGPRWSARPQARPWVDMQAP